MLSTIAPAAARPDYASLHLGRVGDPSETDAFTIVTTTKTTADAAAYASLADARAAAQKLAPNDDSQAVGIFQHGSQFFLQQLEGAYVAPDPSGRMYHNDAAPLTDLASMSYDPPRDPAWSPYRQGASAQELREIVDGEITFDATHRNGVVGV